jgi:hypothetical protein
LISGHSANGQGRRRIGSRTGKLGSAHLDQASALELAGSRSGKDRLAPERRNGVHERVTEIKAGPTGASTMLRVGTGRRFRAFFVDSEDRRAKTVEGCEKLVGDPVAREAGMLGHEDARCLDG